ncbi:MAG: hypothetical protein AAGC88_04110 [Bacteroidota bacterium]
MMSDKNPPKADLGVIMSNFIIVLICLGMGCSEDDGDFITYAWFTPVEVTDITTETARVNTTITYNAQLVEAIGYRYDTVPDAIVTWGIQPLRDQLEITIDGLTPLTAYYIQPFAILDGQTFEGPVTTFTTAGPTLLSLSHANGVPGDTLSLSGFFFIDSDEDQVSLSLDDIPVELIAISTNSASFIVPDEAITGKTYEIDLRIKGYRALPAQTLSITAWERINGNGFLYSQLSIDSNARLIINDSFYNFTANNRVFFYDPAFDIWSDKDDLLPPIDLIAPATFEIGDIDLLGPSRIATQEEREDNTQMLRYNPTTEEWASVAPYPGALPDLTSREGIAISGENKAYFGLGEGIDELWEYDPQLDVWTQLSDFPGLSVSHAQSFLIDNIIIVFRGYDPDFEVTNEAWAYYIDEGVWSLIPASTIEFPHFESIYKRSFSHKRKGYVLEGNRLWQFDFDSSTWQLIEYPLPGPADRYFHQYYIHQNYLYVGFGNSGRIEAPRLGDFYRIKLN